MRESCSAQTDSSSKLIAVSTSTFKIVERKFVSTILSRHEPRTTGKSDQKQRHHDAEGVSARPDDHREDARPRNLRADRDKAGRKRCKDPEPTAINSTRSTPRLQHAAVRSPKSALRPALQNDRDHADDDIHHRSNHNRRREHQAHGSNTKPAASVPRIAPARLHA